MDPCIVQPWGMLVGQRHGAVRIRSCRGGPCPGLCQSGAERKSVSLSAKVRPRPAAWGSQAAFEILSLVWSCEERCSIDRAAEVLQKRATYLMCVHQYISQRVLASSTHVLAQCMHVMYTLHGITTRQARTSPGGVEARVEPGWLSDGALRGEDCGVQGWTCDVSCSMH
jgi:hypothetical protein